MWESAKSLLGDSLKHNGSNGDDNKDNITHTRPADDVSSAGKHDWNMNTEATTTTTTTTTTITTPFIVSERESTPVTIDLSKLDATPHTLNTNGDLNRIDDFLIEPHDEDLDAGVMVTVYTELDGESDVNIDDTPKMVNTVNRIVDSVPTRIPNNSPHTHCDEQLEHPFQDLLVQSVVSETSSVDDGVVELVDAPSFYAQIERGPIAQHHRIRDIRSFFTPAVKPSLPVSALENVSSTGESSPAKIPTAVKIVRKRHVPLVVVQKPSLIVTSTYERNAQEFTPIGIHSRISFADGSVTYILKYQDGHTRDVSAFSILDCISMEELERFENDLFDKNENMETDYYPKMKPPGGNASGGTAAWLSKKADKPAKKPHIAAKDKMAHKHNGAHSLMVQARAFEDSTSSNGEEDDEIMLQERNMEMDDSAESDNISQQPKSRNESSQSQHSVDYDGDGTAKRRRLHVSYNLAELSKKSAPGMYFDNGKWTTQQQPRKRKRRLEGESGEGGSESRDSQSDSSGLLAPTKKKPGRPFGWRKNEMPTPTVTIRKPVHIPTPVSLPIPSQPQPEREYQIQSYPHVHTQTDNSASHVDDEDDIVFEVESIEASRTENGVLQYYIKWLGYSEAFNAWLPESSLEGCERLIRGFERRTKQGRQ